jgi:hypothetical protein
MEWDSTCTRTGSTLTNTHTSIFFAPVEVMADVAVKVAKGTSKRTAAAIGIDDSNPVEGV